MNIIFFFIVVIITFLCVITKCPRLYAYDRWYIKYINIFVLDTSIYFLYIFTARLQVQLLLRLDFS